MRIQSSISDWDQYSNLTSCLLICMSLHQSSIARLLLSNICIRSFVSKSGYFSLDWIFKSNCIWLGHDHVSRWDHLFTIYFSNLIIAAGSDLQILSSVYGLSLFTWLFVFELYPDPIMVCNLPTLSFALLVYHWSPTSYALLWIGTALSKLLM